MNTQQPSTTWTANQLVATAVLLFWAVYSWQELGRPAPEVLVALSSQFFSGLVSYFVPEKVLLERFRRELEAEIRAEIAMQPRRPHDDTA